MWGNGELIADKKMDGRMEGIGIYGTLPKNEAYKNNKILKN